LLEKVENQLSSNEIHRIVMSVNASHVTLRCLVTDIRNTTKQSYPGSVASYDTRSENEVGLFYNDPKPTRGSKLSDQWPQAYRYMESISNNARYPCKQCKVKRSR